MSVSYFVRYDIAIDDFAAFLRHYKASHLPILVRWPGLKRVVLHTAQEWKDPFPVNRGRALLLAQLEFESAEALDRALATPDRAQARRDFEGFPPFEGTVTHQAMLSEEAWRAK